MTDNKDVYKGVNISYEWDNITQSVYRVFESTPTWEHVLLQGTFIDKPQIKRSIKSEKKIEKIEKKVETSDSDWEIIN